MLLHGDLEAERERERQRESEREREREKEKEREREGDRLWSRCFGKWPVHASAGLAKLGVRLSVRASTSTDAPNGASYILQLRVSRPYVLKQYKDRGSRRWAGGAVLCRSLANFAKLAGDFAGVGNSTTSGREQPRRAESGVQAFRLYL